MGGIREMEEGDPGSGGQSYVILVLMSSLLRMVVILLIL